MKNTLLTISGLLGAGILGFATYIVVANEYNYYVSEKKEKEKLEADRFDYICNTLRRIEFDITKMNAKINK